MDYTILKDLLEEGRSIKKYNWENESVKLYKKELYIINDKGKRLRKFIPSLEDLKSTDWTLNH